LLSFSIKVNITPFFYCGSSDLGDSVELFPLENHHSEKSFYKMGNFKLLSRLGQYTYGLYCLHEIAIFITKVVLGKLHLNSQLWQLLILEGGMSLLLSLALAYVSYTFYESRFLKLKNKFAFVTK